MQESSNIELLRLNEHSISAHINIDSDYIDPESGQNNPKEEFSINLNGNKLHTNNTGIPYWNKKELAIWDRGVTTDGLQKRPPTGDIHTWLDGAEPGAYFMNAHGQLNSPEGSWHYYLGFRFNEGDEKGGDYIVAFRGGQVFPAVHNSNVYVKQHTSGDWGAWKHIGDGCDAATVGGLSADHFHRRARQGIMPAGDFASLSYRQSLSEGIYYYDLTTMTHLTNIPPAPRGNYADIYVREAYYSQQKHIVWESCLDNNSFRISSNGSVWHGWARITQ